LQRLLFLSLDVFFLLVLSFPTTTSALSLRQMELQTEEVSLDARTRKLQEDLTETFNKTCAAIEETKHELQARLEAVETRTERGNTPTASTSTAPPPTFNGNTPWSVFRRQFRTIVEYNRWSDREKSTYLITTLKGRAADVLYGIPTNTTYEETLQALEDRFGGQHFSAAYRCQLTTRTQKAGESLQDFATAIELLAHRAYPTLPEDHIRREAGRPFAYGVKDPDIRIQILLGGEKTVNEALRQELELQTVLVAARPHQNDTNTYRGKRSPPPDEKMHNNQNAGVVENKAILRVIAPTEEKQRITRGRNGKLDHQETNRNRREDRNGDQVTTQKQVGTITNCRETGEAGGTGRTPAYALSPPPLRTDRHHGKDRH
jgi:hypothetical protein